MVLCGMSFHQCPCWPVARDASGYRFQICPCRFLPASPLRCRRDRNRDKMVGNKNHRTMLHAWPGWNWPVAGLRFVLLVVTDACVRFFYTGLAFQKCCFIRCCFCWKNKFGVNIASSNRSSCAPKRMQYCVSGKNQTGRRI